MLPSWKEQVLRAKNPPETTQNYKIRKNVLLKSQKLTLDMTEIKWNW